MIFSTLALLLTALGAGPAAEPLEIPDVLLALTEQVDVPAREAGVLAAVKVREGQMVREGDLLAQIVDSEARLAEQRVKSELEIARKNADNDIKIRFAAKSAEVARAELRRSEASVEKYPKSVSDSELDRLRLMVEKAALEVEQAQRELEIAAGTQQVKEIEYQTEQENVRRRQIVAPLEGMVVQVLRQRGEWVKPGETVVHILRLDPLRAEGFLKATYATHKIDGSPVRLRLTVPEAETAEFTGKIVFLHPEIDPVNAQFRVWAEIKNEGLRLRPGMRGKMTIVPPASAATPTAQKTR